MSARWFDQLPAGWMPRRVKTISPVMRGASPRPIDDPIYFDDGGEFAWVRISDVTASNGVLSQTTQRLSTLGASKSVKLPPGKLFLSIAGSVGKPCITAIKACIHDGFVYFPYLPEASQKYLFWIFESRECFSGLGKLGTQLNLNTETVGNISIPFPPLETQKAIADFLDRETARIDQLIEKKQRLAELLVEREKNLIGECLARGIDPEAEFKPSQHLWLGNIPSHWEVFPLKSLIWYQEGPGIMAEDFRDEGVPLVRIKGLAGQHATLKGCNYLDPEKVQKRWKHFRAERGDFLISASATRGGIASLVTEDVAGAIPYTGIIRIKPRKKGYVSEIIPYFLLSSLFDTQIDLLSAGSTIQHFGPTHLGRMKAPLPPQEEQQKIAAFLDERVPLIRGARKKTVASQGKLSEFRSALITAAVTGQIDVATWDKRGDTDQRLDAIEQEMAS